MIILPEDLLIERDCKAIELTFEVRAFVYPDASDQTKKEALHQMLNGWLKENKILSHVDQESVEEFESMIYGNPYNTPSCA